MEPQSLRPSCLHGGNRNRRGVEYLMSRRSFPMSAAKSFGNTRTREAFS